MLTELEKTIRGKQNFLEQVSAGRIAEPKGFYKTIGLDFLTVASAVYFSYALSIFLKTGAVTGLAAAVFPFLIFSALEVIMIKNIIRRLSILLIETLAILLFFYGDQLKYVILAGAVFFALSFWGEIASRTEMLHSTEIKFLRLTLPLLKKTITALILFVIILFLPRWNDKNVFISERSFGGVFIWSAGIANNFYPEFNFDSTIDDFASSIAKYQLRGTRPYEDLPVAAQKTLMAQVIPQVSDQIKRILGGELTGNERLGDALYKVILASLNDWKERFGIWFTVAWVAVVFLVARTIGAVILWISAFLSWLIYELLVAINFIAIRGEAVTKEVIVFP